MGENGKHPDWPLVRVPSQRPSSLSLGFDSPPAPVELQEVFGDQPKSESAVAPSLVSRFS